MPTKHAFGTCVTVAAGAFGLLFLFATEPGTGQTAAASDVRLADVDCGLGWDVPAGARTVCHALYLFGRQGA